MTAEWYITILSDPQGFWKLLHYYLAAPFTKSGIDASAMLAFCESILKHPLILLVITLFVLLLVVSLLVSGSAIAGEIHREKKEQMERQLAKYELHRAVQSTSYISTLLEREECDRIWTTQD